MATARVESISPALPGGMEHSHGWEALLPGHFACMALALVLGLWLATHAATRRGLDAQKVFAAGLVLALLAWIGARLPHVAALWTYYASYPWEIFALWQGGLSSFAGLACGLALAPFAARWHGLRPLDLLDCLAPALALALAVARLGCWLHDCCPGAQLYEAAFLLALWVIMARAGRRRGRGRAFFAFLILYPLARFGLDFLRDDMEAWAWGLTLTQWGAIAALSVAAVLHRDISIRIAASDSSHPSLWLCPANDL